MKKTIISFLILIFLAGCASVQKQERTFNVIVKDGEMSEVSLAFAKRQNYYESDGWKEEFPDGIVFYFLIYPKVEYEYPTLRELRDFRIDGTSYLELTRKDGIDDIEPTTVIYDQNYIHLDENSAFINYDPEKDFFVEKVFIFGTQLPSKGTIDVRLYFGYDNKLEEFNFHLRIEDIF